MAEPPLLVVETLASLLARFSWAYSYRGSLFLIAGGTFLLGVLVVVLLVQSTLFGTPGRRAPASQLSILVAAPRAPPPLPPETARRLLADAAQRPDEAFALGARAGNAVSEPSLDGVLDRFVASGLGDPRIVSTTSHRKVVRVAVCRSCGSADAAGAPRPPACEYERGFLEGGFHALTDGRARVREIACRGRGSPTCDFEVVY